MSEIAPQAVQRAEIVAALNGITATVDGVVRTVTATPTVPKTIAAYCAWPEWVATRPVGWCAHEIDWYVLVALPGADAQTYVAAGDALYEAVMAALADWQVTRAEPVLLNVTTGGNVPALRFTLTI